MAHKILWGADLYKGAKLDKDNLHKLASDDTPFQMLELESKTIDWIRAVADYYEVCGWNNVERKAARIQRNFWMRNSQLNPNDYIVNPTYNQYYQAVGVILPQESQSPLEMFYPLVPQFIDVMRGEFIKRDNTWTIEAIDPYSQNEMRQAKKQEFEEALLQFAQIEKQNALAEMGITEEVDPETYETEMQATMRRMTEIELKAKNFRTVGLQWAEKVLKIHEKRYDLHELEPDAFESGLISDCEFWHLDLLDDDFKLQLLNPKWCDYHKSPDTKYVSQGDYFLWFEFMSCGDIVNNYGRKMKEEDLLKLKDIHIKTQNILVTDIDKAKQGAYYDLTKPWLQATDLNPVMNDALLGKELAYNFMRTPNFDHNMDVDILNPIWGRYTTGHPQMFRVMRLYWRSLSKIGWLTKINRDGTREKPDWVDENYRVTIEPEYDKSVIKEETKDNLLYGEHIDWTWRPEWRHVMKISPNQKHTFWLNNNNLESIYVDGGPTKFQFKGRTNPFDALPPVEGCQFSYKNTIPNSLVDRTRGMQIIYNICMNMVPKKFMNDYGNKVAVDRRTMAVNNSHDMANPVDPVEAFEDKLRNSPIFDYTLSRDMMQGMGNPALPQVLPLSTIQDAQYYFQLGQAIKWEAGELIGITRQRLGGQKASETKYGIEQGIVYSENQTEKYYEQHSNLMQRVRQRMLDAAQFYTTFNDSTRDIYQNEAEENIFLDIEAMDNLLPHYNLYLQSRANVRAALQKIARYLESDNTLPIRPSDKVAALVENSLPKMMSLLKQADLEQEQMAKEQQMTEQQQFVAELETKQRMEAEKLAFEREKLDKTIQKDIDVATIKALGGIQTDVDADTVPDAQENLDNFFRQQEINNTQSAKSQELADKKQERVDKILAQREKSDKEIEKEKVKAKGALAVAKENRTAAELKKKQTAKKKPK